MAADKIFGGLMPKVAAELNANDVKRASHPGGSQPYHSIAVGGVSGLLLQISATGAKSWLLRTVIADRRRAIGLGSYPEISLAEARKRAQEAKEKVRAGVDPIEHRKATRGALLACSEPPMTFERAGAIYLEIKGSELSNAKHRQQWHSTLREYAFPAIGTMPVAQITPQDVLRVLRPIWAEKAPTAMRLRQRIEAVLSWATAAGHRAGDNPARWQGNLRELLPRPRSVDLMRHHPAIAIKDLPAWYAALCQQSGTAAQALRFLALTVARSGEVRGAAWDEMDLDAGIWTIPASRMKTGRDHRVPLSAAALEIIQSSPRAQSSPYVFPAVRGGPLSDVAIAKVMKDLQAAAESAGHPGWLDPRSKRPAVPHGLRSSFRDWAAEAGIDRDLAELALAHTVGSAVERAYRRTDLFDRRREVFCRWQAVLEGR